MTRARLDSVDHAVIAKVSLTYYVAIVTARNGIARSKAVRLPFVVAQ
jgi:hypothetical protein